jgi:hypothetical protein
MHLTGKDKHKLKVNVWEKIFQINKAQKQVVGIHILNKADVTPKLVRTDKKLTLSR